MAYVKLDCGMLDSTTWFDKDVRDVFITALLMAIPKQFDGDLEQIEIDSLEPSGWLVPAGWYGFVDAASLGIINRCGIPDDRGMAALKRLCRPETESRSQSFDGRRMARIDGGFIILNYIKYREKDHTAAERQRRYRERQKDRNAVTSRNITQAEAKAEAKEKRGRASRFVPKDFKPTDAAHEWAIAEGFSDAEIRQETDKFLDHEFAKPKKDFNRAWRNWIRKAKQWKPPTDTTSVRSEARRLGLVKRGDETDEQFQRRLGVALTEERYR